MIAEEATKFGTAAAEVCRYKVKGSIHLTRVTGHVSGATPIGGEWFGYQHNLGNLGDLEIELQILTALPAALLKARIITAEVLDVAPTHEG
jgi:hypothetical protein